MSEIVGGIIQFLILILIANTLIALRLVVISGFNKTKVIFSIISLDIILVIGYIMKFNNLSLSANTMFFIVFTIIAICFIFFYILKKMKRVKPP